MAAPQSQLIQTRAFSLHPAVELATAAMLLQEGVERGEAGPEDVRHYSAKDLLADERTL